MFHDLSKVNQFIGIPWKEDGEDFDGVHCWGLYRLMNQVLLGRELPSYKGRHKTPLDYREVKSLMDGDASNWKQIQTRERQWLEPAQFGDLVLMTTHGWPIHVGFYIGKVEGHEEMVHIEEAIELSATERIHGLQYRNRFYGIYRYAQ